MYLVSEVTNNGKTSPLTMINFLTAGIRLNFRENLDVSRGIKWNQQVKTRLVIITIS